MPLYHYCGNDAFLSILKSKCVRLSDLSMSNDYMEGKWIRDRVLERLPEHNIGCAAKNFIEENITKYTTIIGGVGFCLSEEGDLLSQWRGYADDGSGVSIGFNKNRLGGLGFGTELCKVQYNTESQLSIADSLIGGVKDALPEDFSGSDNGIYAHDANDEIFRYINHLYRMKNPSFYEEKEWRLLRAVAANPDCSNELHFMDFKAKGGGIAPYVDVSLGSDIEDIIKNDVIEEVFLGPRNTTPPKVVKGVLDKYGFPKVEVKNSAASYR